LKRIFDKSIFSKGFFQGTFSAFSFFEAQRDFKLDKYLKLAEFSFNSSNALFGSSHKNVANIFQIIGSFKIISSNFSTHFQITHQFQIKS